MMPYNHHCYISYNFPHLYFQIKEQLIPIDHGEEDKIIVSEA